MQKSPLAIILSTVFIALIGFGIVIPLMPVYAERYGAGGFQVGMLVMTYSLMQFLLAPFAGRLSDRIGRRPVLIGALFLTSISYVVFGLADQLWMLYASRVLAGIGGADITVAQAYIADVTPPEKRSRGMGLFGAAFGVGFVIGPSLTALTYSFHEGMPSFIAAGLAAITGIWALVMLPEPEKHADYRPQQLKLKNGLSRIFTLILSFQFVAVLTQALVQSMIVLFTVERLGWNEKHNGMFLAMIGAVAATVQGGFMGRLAKRFGERTLVTAGLLFMSVGLAFFSFGSDERFLYLGAVINAIGFAITLPSLSSLASQESPPGRQGQTLGIFQSMGSLGRILGPVSGGLLYQFLRPNAPFGAGAVIAFGAAVTAFYFFRKK